MATNTKSSAGSDTGFSARADAPFAVLPEPAVMDVGDDGAVRLAEVAVVRDAAIDDPGEIMAGQLRGEIERYGVVWRGVTRADAAGLDRDGFARAAAGGSPAVILLRLDPSLGEQEYALDIEPVVEGPYGWDPRSEAYAAAWSADRIEVRGGSTAGLRHGVQTLRQIIRQCGASLPAVHIEDRPAMPERGYYLDVTRGRVPTLDWLKEWADRLCLYKYNQLQLYVEHTFAFTGMSDVWRGASPLNAEDIVAFDGYCHERGIELVPSVSTFGHLYMALRTQRLRDLGEFPEQADRPFSFVERMAHHTLNVTLDEAFAFSTRLIDEYMPLFRSRKFNICGDETFDLGKGRSRAEAERVGVGSMYARYVSRLCEYVSSRGREPMLWGDIAVQMPEILPQLPDDAVLLNWQYSPDVTDEQIALVARSGATQIVCPAVHAWNRCLPMIEPAWRNISRIARYGREYGAAGFLLTDWGDYGHINDPRMSVPGMVMGAQSSWSAGEMPYGELCAAVSRVAYGDTAGNLVGELGSACGSALGVWEDIVRFFEVDDGDGRVNRDVVNALWWVDPAERRSIIDGGDLGRARQAVLRPIAERCVHHRGYLRPGVVAPGSDARLIVERACASLESGAGTGGDLHAWRLAARGQDLMNDVALTLMMVVGAGTLDQESVAGLPEPYRLAQDVELWFEDYCRQWREVSRESELRRIAAILWRACDYLRATARA